MAQITIDATTNSSHNDYVCYSPIIWVTKLIGYKIYKDDNFGKTIDYSKTIDGGATWGAPVNIFTSADYVYGISIYPEFKTINDANRRIYISFLDKSGNKIKCAYLDTSDDSTGVNDVAGTAGANFFFSTGFYWLYGFTSITKSKGGNIHIYAYYMDNLTSHFIRHYYSTDGAAWNLVTAPTMLFEDWLHLFPGNEADDDDIYAILGDVSGSKYYFLVYDFTGDSWSATEICDGYDVDQLNAYKNAYADIRESDEHLIALLRTAADEITCYDINGAGSITAMGVHTTPSNMNYTALCIDQSNDYLHIFIAYGSLAGSKTVSHYLSMNGGQTSAFVDNMTTVNDDYRSLYSSLWHRWWGGRVSCTYYDDDDHDMFFSDVSGVDPIITIPTGNYFVKRYAQMTGL